MDLNYCALYLAIIKNYTHEQAFEILENGKLSRKKVDLRTLQEMVQLRGRGLTYKQIGEIFGLRAHAVYKRLKKAQKMGIKGGYQLAH